MKTSFDTDSLIFKILSDSPVKNAINGGIYLGDDRPENSADEDIVINSIDLSQDYLPQIGTSNVNVYVADTEKKIKGKQQTQANRARLRALTNKVLDALRNANVVGLKMIVGNQTILPEPNIKQHYTNIRVEWNIQIN